MNVVEKAICTPDALSGSDVMEAVNGLAWVRAVGLYDLMTSDE
jgi:hypothetical protein